jgi:hypothetical protein
MTLTKGKYYAITKDNNYLTCAADGTVSMAPYVPSNAAGQNYDNSQLWMLKDDPSKTVLNNKKYETLFLHAADIVNAPVSASTTRTDWMIGSDGSIQRTNVDTPLYINEANQPLLSTSPVTFTWNEEMVINFRARQIDTVDIDGTRHYAYLCFIDLPAGLEIANFNSGISSGSTITLSCSFPLPTQTATQTYAFPLYRNPPTTPDKIILTFADGIQLTANLHKLRPPVIPYVEPFQANSIAIKSSTFHDQIAVLFAVNTRDDGKDYSGMFQPEFVPTTDYPTSTIVTCTLVQRPLGSNSNPVAAMGIIQPTAIRYTEACVQYADGSGVLLTSPNSAIYYDDSL